jgi:formate C-acetyltransferase
VADSIAAANGKATEGPTMMLKSAASFDQSMVYAIPVLNLSLSTKCRPEILRALIEGYFKMGGTQVQITYVDRETLLDAKKDPDAHGDLIVRVGGYSQYFISLDSDLQDAVIARTMFDG